MKGMRLSDYQALRFEELSRKWTSYSILSAVLPLTQATVAYTGGAVQRRGRGKVVVAVAAQGGAIGKN